MIHNEAVLCNSKFNAGNLSSNGGAVLMNKFLENAHYFDLLKSITFRENRSVHKYTNFDIAKQLLTAFILGYENQTDANHLRRDPLINDDGLTASQPTLSKFFKRIGRSTNNDLYEIIKNTSCEYVNKNLSDIILDIDSTLIETYGSQEGTAYIHHYGAVGYHPLIVNEGHTGLALLPILRTGSAYSANGAKEALLQVFAFLDLEGKSVHMRGDSAFYSHELMNFLDERDIEFFIRAKNFKKLTEMIECIVRKKLGDKIHSYSADNPYYGKIEYTVNALKNENPYTMAYKCYPTYGDKEELIDYPELVLYCVITNSEDRTAKEIMDYYELRGAAENFNKEIKNDFDAGTLSHKLFLENEFEFLIKAYAYNLYHIFKLAILEGKDQKMMMFTYRTRFQKIAVKITSHGRRLNLNYSSAYPYVDKFRYYLDKVLNYPHEIRQCCCA